MRYTPGDGGNIEDRRGSSGGRGFGGAAPVGVGGLLLLLVLSWATGTNFLQLLDTGGGDQVTESSGPIEQTPQEQRLVGFGIVALDPLDQLVLTHHTPPPS